MAKTNTKTHAPAPVTGGGGLAVRINNEQQLRRLVLAHMLWEDSFYVDGKSIAQYISEVVPKVDPAIVAGIAVEARKDQKLRHVPLYLVRELARRTGNPEGLVRKTLVEIIDRPDEMAEFLALYFKDNKNQPIAAQVKKGLADAFAKFDEYQLAKWDKDGDIKLRDVAFLTHVKPKTKKQAKVIANLVNKDFYPEKTKGGYLVKDELRLPTKFTGLKTPDTWEVALSKVESGQAGPKSESQKNADWTRLLTENKLGAMALLKNLRNMVGAGVSKDLIRKALRNCNPERVLPFRFISAANAAPGFESELEVAMFKCLEGQEKLPGKTILVVDTSGSMTSGAVSKNSDLSPLDAASALAMLVREVCETPVIYATAGDDWKRQHKTAEIPARRGFALADYLKGNDLRYKIGGGGIFIVQAMEYIFAHEKYADRIIVITDEQDCDTTGKKPDAANVFGVHNYLINVASHKNGIGYGKWLHIDGWSEKCIDFIRAVEAQQ